MSPHPGQSSKQTGAVWEASSAPPRARKACTASRPAGVGLKACSARGAAYRSSSIRQRRALTARRSHGPSAAKQPSTSSVTDAS